MVDPETSPAPDQDNWNTTLVQGWIENRMELDRTIIALSAAGIGLLVTLLTTVEIPWWWVTLFYGYGIGAFVLAIRAGLEIFHVNAEHLEQAITDAETGVNVSLTSLDRSLRRRFWSGVSATILVGVLGAAPTFLNQRGEQMSEDKIRRGVTETTQHQGPSEQSSLDKITNLKPRPTSPQDSGGGTESGGGSGGGSDSSGGNEGK